MVARDGVELPRRASTFLGARTSLPRLNHFRSTESDRRRSHQLDGGCEQDRFVQGAVEGAVHRIDYMHTLHLLPYPFWRHKVHENVNPADDQDAFLLLHLSGYICCELPVAAVNLARFQRASDGPHHSTSRR